MGRPLRIDRPTGWSAIRSAVTTVETRPKKRRKIFTMSHQQSKPVVFFDIGGTLAAPRISPSGDLAGLDVYPGVLDVLGRLQGRGVRMGVISNTPDGATRASMRKALRDAGLLPFLDNDLLVFSSTLPRAQPPIRPKPDPSIFAYAAQLTGLDASACVFVGEDREERDGARSAGMRVAPHPRLVEDVLDGGSLRYLRIAPRTARPEGDLSWVAELADRPLVSLGTLPGPAGRELIAVAGSREAGALDDAGYLVTRLGAPDEPASTELYLLRDARAPGGTAGFSAGEGRSSEFFGAELPPDPDEEPRPAGLAGEPAAGPSPWDFVLASTSDGLLVALPAGLSVERFHFDGARHGHTLKLIPSVNRLRAFAGPGTGFAAAGEAGRTIPARDLDPDEVAALMRIDDGVIRGNLDRFAGLADLADGAGPIASRHIRHPDNHRAVRALAAEFEAIGLTTHLRPFSHEGISLENVEAELPGEQAEAVLITAHLDSTAASGGPRYRPMQDPAPGADDDASGVAATLALARTFVELARRQPLRRTVRFVLFNAEEQGLIGSQHYASRAADDQQPIVAVFQMDMIGYVGPNRTPRPFEVHVGHDTDSAAAASLPLADLLGRVRPAVAPDLLAPQVYSNTHPADGDPAAGRSDHASFQDHGYPACVVSEDFFVGPDADSPEPQENPNYHKPGDKSVEYGYAAQIARCIGAASLVIARPVVPSSSRVRAGERAAAAQPQGVRPMGLFVDVRKENRKELSPEYIREKVQSFNVKLGQNFATLTTGRGRGAPHASGVNPSTGTVRRITLPDIGGFAVEDDATPAARVDQAISLASQALGLQSYAGGNSPQFVADPRIQTTSGNVSAIQLSQTYLGIPIFQMNRVVTLKAREAVLVGEHAEAVDPSMSVEPVASVADAWLAAYRHLAEHLHELAGKDEFGVEFVPPTLEPQYEAPETLVTFDQPSKPTVFAPGPLGAVTQAQLAILIVSGADSRLCWSLVLTLPEAVGQFLILASADRAEPEILVCQESSKTASRQTAKTPTARAAQPANKAALRLRHPATKARSGATYVAPPAPAATSAPARGRVYQFNPTKDPMLNQDERTSADFPLPVGKYPLDSAPPQGFPVPWVGPDKTAVGPNVIALKGTLNPPQPGAVLPATSTTGTVRFEPSDPYGDEQKILNIFYFCNYMHDFFELLGFDAAAGNFEGDDPVIARAHPRAVRGTANMLTFPDHQRPLMNMGLVSGKRHTAFSADVVFHEYTHGVSNRLVGGPMNTQALNNEQGASMGEGWSDYFALTIQNFFLADERETTGDWVVNDAKGIRNFPYNDQYPLTFGDMTDPEVQEVHNAGEIWCATLMQMNRELTAALGSRERAYREGWQLVVDSFKLCPVSPGFLDARDAILSALDGRHHAGHLHDGEYASCREAIWRAFARFGMGFRAVNTGSEWNDARDDFHLPDDLGGTEVPRPVRSGAGELADDAEGPTDEPSGFANPKKKIPGMEQPVDLGLQHLVELWADVPDMEKGRILGLAAQYSKDRNALRPILANATLNF